MDNRIKSQAPNPESRRFTRPSLTNLMIGGIAVSLELLSQRMEAWKRPPDLEEPSEPATPSSVEAATPSELVLIPDSEKTSAELARYAALGLVFDLQDKFSTSLLRADRFTRRMYAYNRRFWKPVTDSRFFSPFANRWDNLVRRGENQVSTWIDRGRTEEEMGVNFARQAVLQTTDEVIDVLAVHPGIREMVQKQSSGFAAEFIEEIRERTVSVDSLLERYTNKVFRKNRAFSQPALTASLLGTGAGLFTRLIAFLLDAFIVGLSTGFTGWFLSVISRMLRLETIFFQTPSLNILYSRIADSPIGFLLVFLLTASYFVFFWALIGQTPGKAFVGVRVIPVRGRKVSFGRALLRYIGYLISTACLFMGFLWIMVDDQKQGWHDKISGTRVVFTWHARPDERFLVEEIRQAGI